MSTARKAKPSVNFAKLLQEHHSDLRESLNIPVLIPLLREQELLTVEEWEEMGKQNRFQKIDQLIQILPQKGEQAYLKFISCLEWENEHPAHKELAVKLKKTWQQSRPISQIRKSTTDSDVTKTDLKETITIKLMEQVSEVLQSELVGVDEMIHVYEERIASLQAQLAEKIRTIARLSQGDAEVTKFQQLLNYANSGLGSQTSLHFNTRLLAKYYHDTQKVLKKVKLSLKRDNNFVNRYLDATSEDSDSVRSIASSMGSNWQLNFPKIQKPCSKLSIEEEYETAEEENELSDSSSADETDNEGLNDTQEQLGQDVNGHQLHHKCAKPLPNQQRPASWAYPKKKRASKSISNPTSSTVAPQAKGDCPTDDVNGSTSDSDANDKQLLEGSGIVDDAAAAAASGEVEHHNEDINLACSNVGLSSIDDERVTSCTLLEGYLHKGTGTHDIWKKRYFILTTEFLYYSKSQQHSRSRPMNGFPLIGLALERKKKATFEVINIQATNIKVDKPGRRHVPIANFKVINLKASSEAEALKWIESIEDAITKLKSQYFTGT